MPIRKQRMESQKSTDRKRLSDTDAEEKADPPVLWIKKKEKQRMRTGVREEGMKASPIAGNGNRVNILRERIGSRQIIGGGIEEEHRVKELRALQWGS